MEAADHGGRAHMAPNDSAETTGGTTGTVVGRRRAARYIVPVAVAGVAAATIGLVPALADSGDPELPKISAQELIEKIAASDQQQLSGTMKVTADLGLPSLGGLAGSFAPGGARAATVPPTRRPSCWSSPPARTRCGWRPTVPASSACPSSGTPRSTA
ncbi:hypothetical protein Sfulv_35570 [Streptomyces fulvorobeus]|uniref:Uncharacterized protein n=1 Tax=Streptomyces fulvorobeus TaxID=284028 RepID=A0A7J0CAJ3_9ACTN|nr:hypothetical protein Sfulv_35570 [Streptomyces fulvorobeus]